MTTEQIQAEHDRLVANELRVLEHHNQAIEKQLTEWDRVLSPGDECFDGASQTMWTKICLDGFTTGAAAVAYTTEEGLAEIRNRSRWLALKNEFAISGYENRISYVAGTGHVYAVAAKPGETVDEKDLDDVRTVLKDFQTLNHWAKRQQEIVFRRDRDGEAFLRFFPTTDGQLNVRFIEPEMIKNPMEKTDARFGILFEEGDAETAKGYFVYPNANADRPDEIDAREIQHRKANVDLNTPRGIPLYFPVEKNLDRAEKLLRNMSSMAGFRAAIAMIRKHATGAKQTIQNYVSDMADVKITNSATGDVQNIRNYPPGSILDHNAATEYEFPSHQTDIGSFVKALQADLRAIASRLVMPEFMFTSDASNANFASTMVAEGPAVKMFERLQAGMIEDDLDVMRLAITVAAAASKLPEDILDRVDIVAEGPQVRTRDHLAEAQSDQILLTARVLSRQTFALRHDLDWDDEKENMEEEAEEDGLGGELDLGGGDDDDQTANPAGGDVENRGG